MIKKDLLFRFIIVIIISVSFSCKSDVKQESTKQLHHSLIIAGDNRSELESVLKHYENDSLKLEAAKFLIENMPGHYSYRDTAINHYYDRVDSALKTESALSAKIKMLDSISAEASQNEYAEIEDLQIIKANFLIDNIETSFALWKKGEWAKHLSFDEFCEYLLPYKIIELQPLDNWKSYLNEKFALTLNDMNDCDSYKNSAFRAAYAVNKELRENLKTTVFYHSLLPTNRLDTKIKMPFGSCSDYNYITTAVMRSKGIPIVNDFTPQWPFRSMGHDWSVVLANTGKNIPFSGADTHPGEPHNLDSKMAKVFRNTYAINREITDLVKTEQCIPEIFKNTHLKDVTEEYTKTTDVRIPIKRHLKLNNQYAYLCVFDNQQWVPICWARAKDDHIQFNNVGRDVVYLPVYYTQKGILPFANPFWLTPLGEVEFIVADTITVTSMELARKYPLFMRVYNIAGRVLGGKFQASDNKDFINYVTLHEVNEPGLQTREVSLSNKNAKYRYWRYLSPPKGFCNIAELFFFEKEKGEQLKGEIIGTKGSYNDSERYVKEKVFDNDPLTFFDAPKGEKEAWVGIDFGRPVEIERIVYVPRGDGNSIFIGNEYELFYWSVQNRWASLGKQIANSEKLIYNNVPSKGLYLLRNLTIGKDERIFTYEGGRQVWW